MPVTLDRLQTLKAHDLMSREVFHVAAADTIAAAAKFFLEHGISSAPVVDEAGECVGVLSASDFAKGMKEGRGEIDLVSDHMTTGVRSISPESSLLAAAQAMCDDHIHHLIVLSRENRPLGMVSTLDIVAAVINAATEQDQLYLQKAKGLRQK